MQNTRTRKLGAALGGVAVILAAVLVAGLATAPDAASAAQYIDTFTSRLTSAESAGKLVAGTEVPSGLKVTTHAKSATAVQRPVVPAPVSVTRTAATGSTGTQSAPAVQKTSSAPAAAPAPAPTSSLGEAQAILNRYIAKYPILKGSTVSFGDAKGYQAICYYKSGRIVISPTHTRSLETIIGHEIWHIIDWRDNGVIDWGENVPPK